MESQNLHVIPAALRAASGIVARRAQLALRTEPGRTSAETAGAAAAVFDGAFSGYCGDFSHRLSVVSAALAGAADAFTATEDANRSAMKSISP
ncbi:MAG: hypothetical protein QOJ56_510 [Mycobacterium sp.]|jgi:hypothetical protein|nr:hypothetical protein [Mycobacterium sp.]MDT5233215.1 hypothetical protein [Mycobacterium sp.]MDT5320246.1 hypothetical protein [Mycobacterium sp.]MDT5351978.1 hypothetical protein [Mycobacterium sp.]